MKYFSIEEFTQEPLMPPFVAALIVRCHIDVMDPIREEFGEPIYVSERSGYRAPETEHKKGRSGNSEHCFKGKGAADYTANNIVGLGNILLRTPYTRICYYPDKKFFHCDYKNEIQEIYVRAKSGNWIDVKVW